MFKKMKVSAILVIAVLCLAQGAFAQFAGGNGSVGNPFRIETAAQLRQMATLINDCENDVYKNAHYRLMNDIYLSEFADWTPIGNGSWNCSYFEGTFDGQGFSIWNMNITSGHEGSVGLFGIIGYEGVVKNLTLNPADMTITLGEEDWGVSAGRLAGVNNGLIENCAVRVSGEIRINSGDAIGATYLGGLVGSNEGKISNCFVAGDIFVVGASAVGGLVGHNGSHGENRNIIENSFSVVNITSESGGAWLYGVGGLVGDSWSGTITNSQSTGNILVKSNASYTSVGGLIGSVSSTIVRNCRAMGNVDVDYDGDVNEYSVSGSYAGGLIGNFDGTVENSYAVGNVVIHNWTYGAAAGGLIGEGGGTIRNSFARGDVSAQSVSSWVEVGGLIGASDGEVINSYSTGLVKSNNFDAEIGGLAGGYWGRGGTFTNSYYDRETSGFPADNGKGNARTTAQMKTQGTFTNWDFNTIWGIDEAVNDGYPYLRAITSEIVEVEWGIATLVYNGRPQAPTASATLKDGTPLVIRTEGRQTDVGNSYIATAVLLNPNNFSYVLIGTQREFSIVRADISPILNIANIRESDTISWTVSGNPENGDESIEFATSADGEFSPDYPTEAGVYFARAKIEQTANYNAAITPVVSFAIIAENIQEVAVVWENKTSFVFNGEMQAPTASAIISGDIIQLSVSGGINVGEHIATAVLPISISDVVLTDATKTFEITPRQLAVNAITPISNYPYTGSQIKPDIEVKDGDRILALGRDYEISDYGVNISGTGSVGIRGIGNYTGTATRSFAISSFGAIIVSVEWEATRTFEYNGNEQYPRATAGGYEIEILGKQRNAGSHVAVATLPNAPNVILINAIMPYTISKKELTVNWTPERKFTYNKMVQVPMPSVNDETVELRVVNGQSQVGVYRGVLAPFAMIISSNADNFILRNNSIQEYEIVEKPLEVALTNDSGARVDTVVIDRDVNNLASTEQLIAYIENNIVDFFGFAVDTLTKEADSKSALSGRLSFAFNRVTRSIENGEFVLGVSGENIVARNYTILERSIAISIEPRFITLTTEPREVSIKKVENADKRHGIRFAKNIVSDKAEISVILPASASSATETRIVIYDMTGNVVYSGASTGSATGGAIVWDLRNSAGRFVANGAYLVIAEVKDRNGRTHTYSSRLGVRR